MTYVVHLHTAVPTMIRISTIQQRSSLEHRYPSVFPLSTVPWSSFSERTNINRPYMEGTRRNSVSHFRMKKKRKEEQRDEKKKERDLTESGCSSSCILTSSTAQTGRDERISKRINWIPTADFLSSDVMRTNYDWPFRSELPLLWSVDAEN